MKYFYSIILFVFCCFSLLNAQNSLDDLLNEVDLDSLVMTVKQLSGEIPVVVNGKSETITTRARNEIGNEIAFQFLKEKLFGYGYEIDSMVFSPSGKNLLGIKNGVEFPQKRIMIGAHYDSKPYSGLAPGADDNASGVAAVIEVARVLQHENFPYTIVFALWDEEEPGLLGSGAYVKSIGSENETLLAYINLDMIAWDGDDDGEVEISTRPVDQSLDLADLIISLNVQYNIGLKTTLINPGPSSSDFHSFWMSGYTASGINEVYYGADANPYWHSIEDVIAHFNLNYFLKCTKLTFASVYYLAQNGLNTVTSIKNQEAFNQLSIYPNPVTESFSIANPDIEVRAIKIYDLKGSLVFSTNHVMNKTITLPSFIQSGTYLVELTSIENTAYYTQLVKL